LTSSTTEPGGGPPLLEVGRIVKPHGLAGEVVVELTTDRTERLDQGTTLQSDGGPLVVEASRPFQGRFLVRFAGVGDRTGADHLRGAVLRAGALEDPEALWVHELVGARVVSVDGTALGTVAAVEPNPASDLLVLEGGGLVPLRFVTSLEPGQQVTVDVPPGLLD
jgi:16S rRNA processing protein RimM